MGDGYLGLIHRLSTLEPPRDYLEERELPATDPSMSPYGHSEP